MQMVDTHATDFVNVQKTLVLFKTSTQWIQAILNAIRLIVWWKNGLFSNILYTINKFCFDIDI